ncbi:MAG TPA: ABC transporter ATP-binding protein [Amycolatopsis sp.]|uniref:ABC transporter ATP-binding protein n=1 Tax=Amycolatopsis sp. TaxID=37632 RepID=UPI002B45CC8C|nr:ABC transporter ATP-binding protein [Amycolatopsis sp.]HKS49150.1 ABC transporter ATP-binding protein [Amycolatopsis sp.]
MMRDLGLLRQLWRFRSYGRPHLGALSLGVGLRVGELLADLARPWPLALVIDGVLKGNQPRGPLAPLTTVFGGSNLAQLTAAAVAVLVITLASGVLDYLGDRVMNGAGERITAAIRTDVFAHLQRLPMSFHDHQAVGELTSRISVDTDRIEDSLVDLFSILLPGLLSIAGFAAVLLSVDWRLGLVAISCAPLVFATAARYTRLTRTAARRRRAAEGALAGFVAESLHGIRTIHAFGRHDLHDTRFADGNRTTLDAGLRAVELRARFTPMLEVVTSAGAAVLLWVGGLGVLGNWWTVGLLVVVTSYLNDMVKPMRALSKLSITFSQGAASAERVAGILDQPRRRPVPSRPLPARAEGHLELRGVDLDYGRGPVLHNLDLTVRPAERVALLGPNGAGKSSVLALIAGLYPPTAGQLLLDGKSLAELPKPWLHDQVAVVLQDTFLFSGTLADNIRYARPAATAHEVTQAAKAALVTQFADDLPDGLDTRLADGGVGLSGGQRQRVGIARALLADAPIVLLDEPTAGLDLEAEQLVVRALTRLVASRTVIMTTHRPALTRLAMRTVHLHNGVVVAA